MNRTIRKPAIPVICLLIYFFAVLTPLSSHVFCVGADGHIEFEAAINGRCPSAQANAWTQAKIASTALAWSEDHGGSCFDIPVFASNADQQAVVPAKNTSRVPSMSASAVTTIQPIIYIAASTNNPLLKHRPRANPTLISLRTVTLLI